MSYDEEIAKIEEEQSVLSQSLEPIYNQIYELRLKKEKLLLEKELASGNITKQEELEFRRAMGIYKNIMKQATSCSIYISDEEPNEKKKFSFELDSHYSIHNLKPNISMGLTIKSKVIPVHKLLKSMVEKTSYTGGFWNFHEYHPLEIQGTLSEEEYEKSREELFNEE